MHRRNGLLGSRCQVQWLRIISALHLIEVLCEVTQLASRFHDLLLHKEGGLAGCVVLLDEGLEAVVDERLVEKDAHSFEVVASVAGDSLSALELNHVETLHDLVVMQMAQGLAIDGEFLVRLHKSAHNLVAVFRLADD